MKTTLTTQFVTLNAQTKPKRLVKRTLGGREQWVVNANLIVNGVLPGSGGSIYYGPDVIQESDKDWNGMPIIVYHSTKNGIGISARDPDVLDRQGVGRVFRSDGGNGILKSELWFDPEDTKRVDERVYNSLLNEEPIEISTGLYLLTEPAEEGAVFNEKPYDKVAKYIRPDHLAILPDKVGACSLRDGCGIFNQNGTIFNELSHDQVRQTLYQLLGSQYTQDEPSCYIVEVYDSYVVFYHGDTLYRVPFTRIGDSLSLGGKPQKVQRVTSYEPVYNEQPTEEGTSMTKEERTNTINWLVANCDCWKQKGDVEILNKMTDDKLTELKAASERGQRRQAVLNAAREGFGLGAEASEETILNALKSVHSPKSEPSGSTPTLPAGTAPNPTPTNNNQLTPEQWLASAPADYRRMIQNQIRAEQQQKAQIIAFLTSNIAEGPQKEAATQIYQTMNVDQLQALMPTVRQAPSPVEPIYTDPNVSVVGNNGNWFDQSPGYLPSSNPPPHWIGAHGTVPPQQHQNQQDDILDLPVLNFERQDVNRPRQGKQTAS